jgi:hypothetical protein
MLFQADPAVVCAGIRVHQPLRALSSTEQETQPKSLRDCVNERERERSVKKSLVIGYTILVVGSVIWLYGYFVPGNPSVIDWRAHTPWWIAEFLPNIESEIGMVLMYVSMVALYWPRSRVSLSAPMGDDFTNS